MRAHKNHKTTTKQEKFLILCKNFLSSRLGEFLLFSIQTIKMTQNFVHRLMKIILLLLCEVNWLSCPVKLKSDSWIEREWKSFLICFLVPSRSRVKNKHIIFFVIVQHISQTHMELVAPGDLNDKDYKKKCHWQGKCEISKYSSNFYFPSFSPKIVLYNTKRKK